MGNQSDLLATWPPNQIHSRQKPANQVQYFSDLRGAGRHQPIKRSALPVFTAHMAKTKLALAKRRANEEDDGDHKDHEDCSSESGEEHEHKHAPKRARRDESNSSYSSDSCDSSEDCEPAHAKATTDCDCTGGQRLCALFVYDDEDDDLPDDGMTVFVGDLNGEQRAVLHCLHGKCGNDKVGAVRCPTCQRSLEEEYEPVFEPEIDQMCSREDYRGDATEPYSFDCMELYSFVSGDNEEWEYCRSENYDKFDAHKMIERFHSFITEKMTEYNMASLPCIQGADVFTYRKPYKRVEA